MLSSMEQITTEFAVVDFGATWCGPCRALAPIFEDVSKNHPDISFVKIDVDENATLANEFNIRSVPTLVFLKDKQVIHTKVGSASKNQLEDLITNYCK